MSCSSLPYASISATDSTGTSPPKCILHVTLSLSYCLPYVSHTKAISAAPWIGAQSITSLSLSPSLPFFLSLRYCNTQLVAVATIKTNCRIHDCPVLCVQPVTLLHSHFSNCNHLYVWVPHVRCAAWWAHNICSSVYHRRERGTRIGFRWVCGGKTAIHISIRTRTTELFAGFVRSLFQLRF